MKPAKDCSCDYEVDLTIKIRMPCSEAERLGSFVKLYYKDWSIAISPTEEYYKSYTREQRELDEKEERDMKEHSTDAYRYVTQDVANIVEDIADMLTQSEKKDQRLIGEILYQCSFPLHARQDLSESEIDEAFAQAVKLITQLLK